MNAFAFVRRCLVQPASRSCISPSDMLWSTNRGDPTSSRSLAMVATRCLHTNCSHSWRVKVDVQGLVITDRPAAIPGLDLGASHNLSCYICHPQVHDSKGAAQSSAGWAPSAAAGT